VLGFAKAIFFLGEVLLDFLAALASFSLGFGLGFGFVAALGLAGYLWLCKSNFWLHNRVGGGS